MLPKLPKFSKHSSKPSSPNTPQAPVPPIALGPNKDSANTSPAASQPTAQAADKTTVLQPLSVLGSHASHFGAASETGANGFDDNEQAVEERLAYENLMKHRKQRQRRRLGTAAVVVALIVAYGIYAALSRPQLNTEGLDTQTVSVVREDFVDSIEGTGKAQPLSSTVITPEVDGIIASVNVKEGDVVKKGDTLLTITNSDLDKAVNDASIAVQQAELALKQARAAYSAAEKGNAQLEEAARAAAASGATGADEEAGLDAGASMQDLTSLSNEIENAKLAVQQAQDAYDQAVAQAAKRTVVAPSDGTVVVMNAKPGVSLSQSMAAGAASGGSLMEISDLTQMTVRIQVSEIDISKVHVDQKARVSFAALPDMETEAVVTRISSVSSAGSQVQDMGGTGAVTYDVDLLIPKPVDGLKPGMTASVQIVLQEVPDTMTVPATAVGQDGEDSYFVMRKGEFDKSSGTYRFERVPVTVVAQTESVFAIEGVEEGDELALDPYSVLDSSDEGAAAATDKDSEAPTSNNASTSDATTSEAA